MPQLVFSTNRPPLIPHSKGGGITARYGPNKWELVGGCYPFIVQISNSQYVAFVHDADYEGKHSFVCVDTDRGVFLQSEVFNGPLLGPCPGFVAANLSFEACGLKYVEADNAQRFEYCVKLVSTNHVTLTTR